MKHRLFWSVVAALVGVLLLVIPALAGGWAVVTLDSLPAAPVAGQPFEVGFSVRQHGRTPLQVPEIQIQAHNPASGERLSFTAAPDGPPGHYKASLLFPSQGAWQWSIRSGLFPEQQPMPALEITGTAGAASQPRPNLLPLAAAAAGALGLAAAAALTARRRMRWAPVAAIPALALLVVALAAGLPARRNASAVAASGPAASSTGQALFVAKGCVVCHVHAGSGAGPDISTQVGPDLSRYSANPDYLRGWLADPAAVRPQTEMPDLGLSSDEIEALVAFLNQPQKGE